MKDDSPAAPDVRGWPVYAGDSRRIGEVDDLVEEGGETALRVRLDRDTPGSLRTLDRDAVDPTTQAVPELDGMRGLEGIEGIAGIAAVPGETPTVGGTTLREHLVRETLSDIENQLTAEHHIDDESYGSERFILVPLSQASLDADIGRVVLERVSTEAEPAER
jgi:hypothetical protein